MSVSRTILEAAGWLRWRLRPLAILTVLLSIGAWGHHTHWSLGHADEDGDAHALAASHGARTAPAHSAGSTPPGCEDQTAERPVAPEVVGPNQVRFASPEACQRAGLVIETVSVQALERCVVANGVVGYDQTRVAQLSAKVPGAVWRVEKKLGQSVQKGDVLALVESADVGRAKSEFLSAVANLNHLQTRLNMVRPLADVVAARQIREAEAAVREARIQVYNTHQALVNLGLPIDPDQALATDDVELRGQMQFLGLPPAMAATLDPKTTTANLIPLVAPFDGYVIGRDVVLGEVALPTQPQFTIADCSHLWITLQVRIEDANEVQVGQPVRFHADGTKGDVECQVRWISPEMDEKTRTVEVRADVLNPWHNSAFDPDDGQWALHVNAFGTGQVRTLSKASAMCVPNTAVQFDGGQPVVFVARPQHTFERVPVSLGETLDDVSEVTEGLAADDRVVTVGSLLLKAELGQHAVSVASHAAAPQP